MINSLNPPSVWSSFGTFSMAVVQGAGQLIHLKGQVSLDKDGQFVGAGDMRTQVRQTLENIDTVLGSFGGKMSDVLSLTHFAADIEAFMRAGDVRKRFFAAPYPVTTTVEVTRLYHPDLLIEITAIAEIPHERFKGTAGQGTVANSPPPSTDFNSKRSSTMPSLVTEVPAAVSDVALEHFTRRLSLETDCADVQDSIHAGATDFVLLDVRGPKAYEKSHIPGALNLPHREINGERLQQWATETTFVVYCAGPHCNGADRAAAKLAKLGRPVKIMIGGMTGWIDEGYCFATGQEPLSA